MGQSSREVETSPKFRKMGDVPARELSFLTLTGLEGVAVWYDLFHVKCCVHVQRGRYGGFSRAQGWVDDGKFLRN
jgi:hypothetical protein